VLADLSRYTHRVAISNSRLVSADANTMAFRWKDYRIKSGDRMKIMGLDTGEFIRRFLMHVLPDGFHRIRHYGLLASAQRKANIAKARFLIGASEPEQEPPSDGDPAPLTLREPCPLLRRNDADHRDIQARRGPSIPYSTKRTGRMTQCPFTQSIENRLPWPHRLNPFARSGPTSRTKGAERARSESNLQQMRKRNMKTANFNPPCRAATAASDPTGSTRSP